ncbi:hypothetical protein A3D70_01870 [Candidatus Adlerbacteria bacterium RIFCSPHIGHO2_02_FULL_54_18]|uniref:UDP-N-acetylglucosamine 2-epimerase domain-containing protein n=2 Tax=Candidatus Adleribacteriota TaxID=1752736 RepID=A0A1F4Y243_9BACT|nr:MAG: hypothetical protein A2949_01570 [Candidatus Adlerbacteria bacterium RIFCSPLOWO2_01_FULL_54_21b]OGC88012.1 MAG: hypothetical protein A3D70_01870 [Candidatus Adlerbacteria bacterium RIFCSPHIGHO2_02_FULL_54_18]
MNERKKKLYIVYELEHLPQLEARLRAGEELEVIALDFEVELELRKRGIVFTPLRSVARSCEGQREPIEVTRMAANEWYKHPELAFFAHDGILLGEPHAGPLHHYFGMLVYYLVLFEQILARPGIGRIFIPESFHTVGVEADPTAYFKERLQVDVAQLIAERRGIEIEVIPALPKRGTRYSAWVRIVETATRCIIGLLNILVTLLRKPRPLKILSTDPWARIEPFIKDMPDTELVMTRRKEIPRMGWAIWSKRVRFHHPLDFADRAVRKLALARAEEFARAWDALGDTPDISKLFVYNGSSFWPVAKQVLGSIVKDYAEDAVATIESAKAMLRRYRINRVLLFGSTKGYNNLWARVAERLNIPSVEMQHALEVTELSHPYARLYSRYLAAYGALTKKHYEQFGVEPRRIIEVGSPRFDRYAEPVPPRELEAARARLGIDGGLTALVTLPARGNSLEPSSFTSHSVADSVDTFAGLQKKFPKLRLLLRPRPGRDSLYERQEIRGMFAAGTSWVQDEDLRMLLALCDFVVSGNSTVVLEAMLMHKPVLLYVRPIDQDFREFEEAGAVMVARTPQELLQHAEALLDQDARTALVARAESFLQQNFVFNGKASTRIEECIRELPAPR